MAKKLVVLSVLLALFAGLVSAAVFQYRVPELSSHRGQCYTPNSKHFFTPGTTYYDNKACLAYTCQKTTENGKNMFHGQGAGCGAIGKSDGCKVVPGKFGKRYPKCCPSLSCS